MPNAQLAAVVTPHVGTARFLLEITPSVEIVQINDVFSPRAPRGKRSGKQLWAKLRTQFFDVRRFKSVTTPNMEDQPQELLDLLPGSVPERTDDYQTVVAATEPRKPQNIGASLS